MGRPKMKAELVEGPQAFKNFEEAAKAVFRASKTQVEEGERKHKPRRKRKQP